jgi:hypothetical protein
MSALVDFIYAADLWSPVAILPADVCLAVAMGLIHPELKGWDGVLVG